MGLSADLINRLRFALTSQAAADELTAAVDGRTNLADGKIDIGDVNGVAQEQTLSGDVTVTRLGVMAIGAGKVTNAMVVPNAIDGTVAANIADANVIGGLGELIRVDIAAGALADKDVIMTHKVRVIDCWHILRGAGVATTTFQVKNGAAAISSLMAASGADQALVRTTSIDDAAWEIAAAGTLRVSSATGASQPAATVYVLAHRVP